MLRQGLGRLLTGNKTGFSRCFATTSDKTVYLVFGGTGAVGQALVNRLAKQPGAVVVAASTDSEVQKDAEGQADNVHGCSCDVLDSSAVKQVVEDVVKEHGSLYGVANCVGTVDSKPTHLLEEAEFEHHLRMNVLSSFSTIKGSVRALMKDGGSIALVGAAVAHKGTANHDAIAAAKGAVSALARGAAATYADQGIRINCVVPSLVEQSDLTKGLTGNKAARDVSERMHALKGVATPDDVASALEFVLHPGNRFVTGSDVFVDGGLSHLAPSTTAA